MPTFVVVTSTTGDAPVTVTFSVRLPICICASCEIVWPSTTWMLSRSNFLKPCRSNESLYVPDGNAGNRYLPSASVTVVRVPISAGDVAVTVTPGNTAPCASVTVPASRPCPIWANAGVAKTAVTNQRDDEPCRSRSHRGPPLKNQTIAGNCHELFRVRVIIAAVRPGCIRKVIVLTKIRCADAVRSSCLKSPAKMLRFWTVLRPPSSSNQTRSCIVERSEPARVSRLTPALTQARGSMRSQPFLLAETGHGGTNV